LAEEKERKQKQAEDAKFKADQDRKLAEAKRFEEA
jgi:hypothetical protein